MTGIHLAPFPASLLAAAAVGITVAVWGTSPDRRISGTSWMASARRFRGWSPRTRWVRLGLLVGMLVGLVVVGPMAVVPSVVLLGSGVVFQRRRRAAQQLRRRQKQDRDDVQALRALAAELRSGLPPPDALRAAAGGVTGGAAAPAGLRTRMLAAAAADKLGGDPALTLAGDSEPGSAAAGVAAAWAVCQVTGASLAAPVTRIADAAASGLLLAREADAALASARSSARLLAVLPVAGVAIGVLSGTGSLRVLFATGPGQLCLLTGTALELVGLAWLDRLAVAAG